MGDSGDNFNGSIREGEFLRAPEGRERETAHTHTHNKLSERERIGC